MGQNLMWAAMGLSVSKLFSVIKKVKMNLNVDSLPYVNDVEEFSRRCEPWSIMASKLMQKYL